MMDKKTIVESWMDFFQLNILHRYIIIIIPIAMKKGFSGAIKENNRAIIAPSMVLSIRFLAMLKDSDTEDCMAIIAAIPAKNGLFKFITWAINMVKLTAKAVLMVRIPILSTFMLLILFYYYTNYRTIIIPIEFILSKVKKVFKMVLIGKIYYNDIVNKIIRGEHIEREESKF